MGGVRMSEDEGDEKERSIILPCFQNPARPRARAHICTYISAHMLLHPIV